MTTISQSPRGLTAERCDACQHTSLLRRGFCPKCSSRNISNVELSPLGKIWAATNLARSAGPGDQKKLTYIYLVELEGGIRLMASSKFAMEIGHPAEVQKTGDEKLIALPTPD